jgi:exonuclease VII large subunit
LKEKEEAYASLLQDYEKVYDAYYQLETKFVQLSRRPYKKFQLSDTTRHIGADIHWFADEGEVMLNIDSLPALDSGAVYMVFARTAKELTPIGTFDQPLKMFEMGDFEPVKAPLGFIIKQVKGDSSVIVVSSD